MNAPARMPKLTASASTKANVRAVAALADAAHARTATPIDTAADRDRGKSVPNPLWVIAVAMAVFFGATALLMMF
jgi:hypothetical protein